jgi:hypothetical protein
VRGVQRLGCSMITQALSCRSRFDPRPISPSLTFPRGRKCFWRLVCQENKPTNDQTESESGESSEELKITGKPELHKKDNSREFENAC